MTDPVLPSAAERLAALRAPSTKRSKAAHPAKVLTAGISATALFAMVAVMGWQTRPPAATPVVIPVAVPAAKPALPPNAQTAAPAAGQVASAGPAAASNVTTQASG